MKKNLFLFLFLFLSTIYVKPIFGDQNLLQRVKNNPNEAYLLLHCGIGSIKSLSELHPYELNKRIGRLERSLGTKTQTKINLGLLKSWIERAKNNL